MHICIFIYTYIPKYSLLTFYNITGVLEPGKTVSPTVSNPHFPIVVSSWGLLALPSSTWGCLLSSISSRLGSHAVETLWVLILALLGDTDSQQMLWSSGSYTVFLLPIQQCLLNFRYWNYFVDLLILNELWLFFHINTYFPIMCENLHALNFLKNHHLINKSIVDVN